MDAFTKQALDAHNTARAQHNVPSLKWSQDLERDCQAWAKKIAKQNKLQHANDLNGIGENIFMTSRDSDTLGTEATKSWYSEIKKYNFKRGRYQGGTGHFTQVVWKSSAELGIAKAKSPSGNVYIVARYSPGGNDLNKFDDNILPPNTSNPMQIFEEGGTSAKEMSKVNGEQERKEIKERKAQTVKLDDSMINELLEAHNKYRALHGVPPVTWSDQIANEAQQFAAELARTGKLGHANKEVRKYQGENVCRMSQHYKPTDAISFWYAEVDKYDFSSPGFSVENGHFTQLVWQKTQEIGVGCARSENKDGLTYMVARYWPPGNVTDAFEQNVLPPLSS